MVEPDDSGSSSGQVGKKMGYDKFGAKREICLSP